MQCIGTIAIHSFNTKYNSKTKARQLCTVSHCFHPKSRYDDLLQYAFTFSRIGEIALFLQPMERASHINELIDRLANQIARFGYAYVDTPIIQDADLFLTKAGDSIITRLFTFERFGRQFCLRPEFTASAARLYADNQLTQPVRWQFNGPVFADDPDDYHHRYQRESIGAELIGESGPMVDAEMIALAAFTLESAGVDEWRCLISHAGLIRAILKHLQLDSRTQRLLMSHLGMLKANPDSIHALMRQLGFIADQATVDTDTGQLLDTLLGMTQPDMMMMGGRTRHDIAQRLLRKRRQVAEYDEVFHALNQLSQWADGNTAPLHSLDRLDLLFGGDPSLQAIITDWRQTFELLYAYGIPADRLHIDPGLARGWDYYTGIVFEMQTSDKRALVGGGRYDELVRLMGHPTGAPAVGFACYPDELASIKQPSEMPPCLVIVPAQAGQIEPITAWCVRLRGVGIGVIMRMNSDTHQAACVIDENHLQFSDIRYTADDLDSLIDVLNRNPRA